MDYNQSEEFSVRICRALYIHQHMRIIGKFEIHVAKRAPRLRGFIRLLCTYEPIGLIAMRGGRPRRRARPRPPPIPIP